MCKQNAENRKKKNIPHIGGSKSNVRRRAEMMVEIGHKSGRAELYLATHKKEDGSYVNEVAKEICFADFFTSTPSDVSSGPLLDVNGRSSGDSYSSDDY
ncbi:hypothetical protein FXO38_34800 [Capsicum annuum]|nr:hypothetical protein FXO38_34800 [Capsicum annuum]